MDDSYRPWSTDEAMRYESFAEQSFSWQYIEEPSLRSLLAGCVNHQTTALDLGCGGGRIIRLLQTLGVPDYAIHGVDNDATLIEIARVKFPNVHFRLQELTDTPYKGLPRQVDVVTAHFILQYLPFNEVFSCLREVRGLLEPHGFLAIGLPHPVRVAQQAGTSYFARSHSEFPAPWGGTATSTGLTVSDYVNTLIQAGFRITRLEEPELTHEGEHEVGANAYSAGPTRLMLLAQAA